MMNITECILEDIWSVILDNFDRYLYMRCVCSSLDKIIRKMPVMIYFRHQFKMTDDYVIESLAILSEIFPNAVYDIYLTLDDIISNECLKKIPHLVTLNLNSNHTVTNIS